MTRIAIVLVLTLLAGAAGCKKAGSSGTGASGGADSGDGSFRFRPKGGSTTILGKARDRALDAELINEMRQVTTAIEADDPGGRGPADRAAWLRLLRDFRNLRPLVESGEVVTFPNVNILNPPGGRANAVLMYEKRVVDENDGIVLTCDGAARRMTRAQFEALSKPK